MARPSPVALILWAAALAALVLQTTAHGTKCPHGSIPGFNDSHTAPCYLYERVGVQFVTAERFCRIAGGHLASIPDGFVNAFVARCLGAE
ncbi:hypothetical protein AAVH_28463 [Aphelenchoides avenae]|nr:hypothetical protein AAVH_28463 [Aphelenchus avenae]